MTRRSLFKLSCPVLLGALLAGCARRETTVTAGNRDQILYRGNASEPESLDPYLVRGAVEWTMVGGLFEGLVVPDLATLAPRPGVAERWEISADGRRYRFQLRAAAVWSDGTPLTAHDFEYGARRMLAPRLGSAHSENTLFFVQGAREYQAGRVTDWATPQPDGVRLLHVAAGGAEAGRARP